MTKRGRCCKSTTYPWRDSTSLHSDSRVLGAFRTCRGTQEGPPIRVTAHETTPQGVALTCKKMQVVLCRPGCFSSQLSLISVSVTLKFLRGDSLHALLECMRLGTSVCTVYMLCAPPSLPCENRLAEVQCALHSTLCNVIMIRSVGSSFGSTI